MGEQVAREFMAWARQPFYSNTKTFTRSWTEVDKNGKVHSMTETRTKGFSISNGTVLGGVALAALWEVGLAVSKAFGPNGSAIQLAEDIMFAPVIVAYDITGAVVGFAQSVAGELTNTSSSLWNWLDGNGATNKSPPPTATKTAAMPATAMAAHNQLLTALISPVGALGTSLAQKLVGAIQNAPT